MHQPIHIDSRVDNQVQATITDPPSNNITLGRQFVYVQLNRREPLINYII